MGSFRFLSHSEQLAGHLREELIQRRRVGTMPGVPALARELTINHKTAEGALRLLEEEGLLVAQGAGRPRRINLPADHGIPDSLSIGILLLEESDGKADYILELVHLLTEAGNTVSYAQKSMTELGMDPKRIARMIKKSKVDLWVVLAGSHEILKWFSTQATPVLALFGRSDGLLIPSVGVDLIQPCTTAVRTLIELGHQRIVSLNRRRRSNPEPSSTEKAILSELTANGIPSGTYNQPFWEETPEGFQCCLDSLFSVTPPTALILYEAPLYTAAQQFIAQRKVRVPEDVSMLCIGSDPHFAWCQPSISHIHYDLGLAIRRVVRWVEKLKTGNDDKRQSLVPAVLIEGGTIAGVKE